MKNYQEPEKPLFCKSSEKLRDLRELTEATFKEHEENLKKYSKS
jgi:hypothetical protein